MDKIVVAARLLRKEFPDCTAVDGISFEVRRSECFGFLGPNGAGKTTTVRMASCFIEPSSGSLDVLGFDVLKHPRKVKARLGVCPQEDNLDPDLSVEKNLIVFARYFDIVGKEACSRAEELLHFVGLFQKRKSQIDELSGGMKRRLVIARSLINRPELLMLDEPTTGLDPQAKPQVWETIIGLKNSGTTVILTSHYMEEAAHLCDRLIIMDQGRIMAQGSPKELVNKYVKAHVIEAPAKYEGIEPYLKDRGLMFEKTTTHYVIYAESGVDEFKRLSEKFGEGIFSLRMSNLEDVFLKMTGRELRE
ncbi:MAG TPA: ABC transporter ATP-binding protein [Candidatus Omnitrophota bacterium]|nr:ABC transporter ATP-binding protein [Candidatus Omnitrophota bacterium]